MSRGFDFSTVYWSQVARNRGDSHHPPLTFPFVVPIYAFLCLSNVELKKIMGVVQAGVY
jgi:hypothetical protein